jgi:cytochrome c
MSKSGLAILAFFVIGGGLAVWGKINAPETAPQTQGHSMTPPDTSSIAEGAPIAEVALPAEWSPEAQIGKRAFDAKCARCHGANAAGQNGVAPPLVHQIYEPGHHSDAAFVYAARNGVQSHHWDFGNMAPVDGLTDADVKYIARYVRELQRENGIR